MAGTEVLFGVAGILSPLIVAPIGSAIYKRFHKPRYDYYSDRDEVCDHFNESWASLSNTILRINSALQTLAHDSHDRRTVLKEIERTTRIIQDLQKHMYDCKPIGNALKEQEKTEAFLEAVENRIGASGAMVDEKIAMMLGSIVAAELSVSSSLNSPNRENTGANRNLQTMEYENSKFNDEGFFEDLQSEQQFRIAYSRENHTKNNGHSHNAAHYEHDCLQYQNHHHRKRHHNCASRLFPPGVGLNFHENCYQGSLRAPRRERRYHQDGKW